MDAGEPLDVKSGEVTSQLPVEKAGSCLKAFGAVLAIVPVVQGVPAPVPLVVHPVGSAGAATASKFSA